MRILEAFGEPIADGGQEAFVFGVMDHMDMSGMTVDCLTAYDCRSDHYRRKVENRGGRVYALNMPFAPGKSRHMIARPFRDFLKKHSYDVVHVHSGSTSALAIMAREAKKAGTPKVIVHSHISGEAQTWKRRILKALAALVFARSVDRYLACSEESANWMFEPGYARKAIVIKNGVDLHRFCFDAERRRNARQELGLPKRAFVIGHTGRFTKEKNHRFLVDVFREAARRDPDAALLLVGDGEDREAVMAQTASYGLTERVIFAGSVTNVEDYLQAMDIFVFPSLYEGLGIVAIEAQACGLAVIASNHVPKTVNASGHVEFFGLEAGTSAWAEAILRHKHSERFDNTEALRNAGYDIQSTASVISGIYGE